MGKPQQPEIERSGRGAVDPDHVKARDDVAVPPKEKGRAGHVPPSNKRRPLGAEQDKPRDLGGAGHGKGRKKDR